MSHILVTGAAGFIGSHLTKRLLLVGHTVTGIDCFRSGSRRNLGALAQDTNFNLLEGDLSDAHQARTQFRLASERGAIDAVWHLAANSDIAAGTADAGIDLSDTFLTTFQTLRQMQCCRIPQIVFASSSAVYGQREGALSEDTGPLFPISNYGAMKLASEGLITAAVESWLERAYIIRLPNVTGPFCTHGVILDLIKRLLKSPDALIVKGDGSQQKVYVHVNELLDAMLFITSRSRDRVNCFNIGPADEGATVRSIAEEVVRTVSPGTPIRYTGGPRGWTGDVPRFRYCTSKLRALGWEPRLSSSEAIRRAILQVYEDISQCRQ